MNPDSPSGTRAQPLRTRLREATSAAILDAAEEVFADRGLATATMNDVAAAAGVAVGTLYNHFKDRDALLAALLAERRAGLLVAMDEYLEQPSSGNFVTDLKGLVHRVGGYFEQHRRFHLILHQLDTGLNAANYPETCASSPKMKAEMYVRIDKMMKRGAKMKAIRPELVEWYPALLLGMLRTMRLRLVELGRSNETLPLDDIIDLFMNGAGV